MATQKLSAQDRQIISVIMEASRATGVDPEYMLQTAMKESSLNPLAANPGSPARGLYQFMPPTWLEMVRRHGAKYGYAQLASQITPNNRVADPKVREEILNLRFNPRLAAYLGAEFTKENSRLIRGVLSDREPNNKDLYTTHFFGAGDARKFFPLLRTNPNAIASTHFPKPAAQNRNIFFKKDGTPRTVSEVYQVLAGRLPDVTREMGVASIPSRPEGPRILPTETAGLRTAEYLGVLNRPSTSSLGPVGRTPEQVITVSAPTAEKQAMIDYIASPAGQSALASIPMAQLDTISSLEPAPMPQATPMPQVTPARARARAAAPAAPAATVSSLVEEFEQSINQQLVSPNEPVQDRMPQPVVAPRAARISSGSGAPIQQPQQVDDAVRAANLAQLQRLGGAMPTYAEGGFIGPNGVPIRPAGMQTQTAPMAAGQPTSEELDASINETLQANPQVVEQIRQVIMEAMQSGELTPQELNTLGQMAQASLQDPSLYPQLRQMAIREGLVEEEDLPTQYEPAIISLMLVAVRSMGQAPSAGAPQQTPQMQPAGITPTAQMPSMAMGGPVPASMSRSGAVPILAHEGEFVVPKHIVDEKGREFFTNMLKKYSPEGQTKNVSRG